MSPSHSRNRFGACYRYYISQAIIKFKPHEAGTISKIPAKEIEDFAILKITELIKNKELILEYTNDFPIKKQNRILTFLESYTPDQVFIRTIIHKVIIYENKIEMVLNKDLLIKSIEAIRYKQLLNLKKHNENLITYDYDVKLSPAPQRGTKIVIGHNKAEYNLTLIQALTKGFYYNKLVE